MTGRNYEALIEEVKADLSKYDDAGLIDETSLYRDIVLGLKRFGNDVMTLQETVVDIKDSKGELPQGFFSLYAAFLCEPLGYQKDDNVDVYDLQSSHFYREKVKTNSKWNECNPCCEEKEENIVKENLYFKNNKVSFYYKNPQLLKLGKTFQKNSCHKKCRNKIVRESPYEIVIIGTTLQTNFEDGEVYMQYYGLPMDEDGNIDIPDTKNGSLEMYLEYFLKERLAERLASNNDTQNLFKMYQIFSSKTQVYLRNAMNELKMTNITPRTMKRIAYKNRTERLQYETSIPYHNHLWR